MAGKPGLRQSPALVPALAATALALAWKAGLLALRSFPFNADEAVVGLMARHILAGERPAFFYGQAYMGSLDAALVALGFAVFGQQTLVIRVVQAALYAGTVVTTSFLAYRVTGRREVAWVSGLLMAVPSVNATLYTTASLGGYGEALLIGSLLLLLTLTILAKPERLRTYFVWGLLAGLGFWAFGLVLVVILPAGAAVIWRLFRRLARRQALGRLGLLTAAAALGASPWIAWALENGLDRLLSEISGSAIAGASPASPLAAAGSHLVNLLVLGTTVILGLRPPWEVRWLAMPLIPLAVAFWIAAAVHLATRIRNKSLGEGRWLLVGTAATLTAAFVLTPFGADPSGRYFLPLVVPMAIFAGDLLVALLDRGARALAAALLVGLLAFHTWGTLASALRNPPGITTQFDASTRIDPASAPQLAAFLDQTGEARGYTTYWVAYPLAFLTGERIIYVPRLPYHLDLRYTPRDDRYPPYDDQVASSPRVAYITARHPALDQVLRQGFADLGVTWLETTVGDCRVFYGLSRPVHPEELGLGERR